MPRFVDDGRFFKVVLWNMNFDTPQDTPQVEIVLEALGESEMSLVELMGKIGLADRKNFRDLYLKPSLDSGLIEMTIPGKPTSRNQRYRAVK